MRGHIECEYVHAVEVCGLLRAGFGWVHCGEQLGIGQGIGAHCRAQRPRRVGGDTRSSSEGASRLDQENRTYHPSQWIRVTDESDTFAIATTNTVNHTSKQRRQLTFNAPSLYSVTYSQNSVRTLFCIERRPTTRT